MTAAHRQAVLTALTDLVSSAGTARDEALEKNARGLATSAERIRAQCDAARTRLVEDRDEYVSTAWAIIDTCRIALAETRLRISHARSRRT